jgi:tripartite-type tricarboxylate transporter receptor subunit TctC
MASNGNGTTAHVAGELFKLMTGVDMVHVPYRGPEPALTDLLAGKVQVRFGIPSESIEYIRAGKLPVLAVTTVARSDALPDTPTVGEFVPGYEASAFFGIGAPKSTATELSTSPGNQRGALRSKDQGAPRRSGRYGACRDACRFQQAHRRRHREMG